MIAAVTSLLLIVRPWDGRPGGAGSIQSAGASRGTSTAGPAATRPRATSLVLADTLYSGESLTAGATGLGAGGSRLLDYSGTWQVFFSVAGDIRLEGRDKVVGWAAGVTGAHQMRVLSNGVLEITNDVGATLWTSNPPQPDGNYYLLLQDDGNLILKMVGSDEFVWKSQADGGCFGGNSTVGLQISLFAESTTDARQRFVDPKVCLAPGPGSPRWADQGTLRAASGSNGMASHSGSHWLTRIAGGRRRPFLAMAAPKDRTETRDSSALAGVPALR